MPAPPIPDAAPRIAGDRYAIVSRIGEGGMSSVYRAYDRKLGVWRAIKMLHPQHARRARLRNRFESEARTMARLEHPHLVRIYDVGVEGKLPFMVMEIVLGGSLQDWIDRSGPMPVTLALQCARQVLLGVECVHEAGIVHRDIKPHNVLVAPPGACKLTDFGIAQIQDDARTKTGSVLGTQGYMAPEQRLDAKTVDHRADLYGVGAMLWSLLTGRIAQDLYNFGKQPKLSKGVDPQAAPILARALTYSRDERYQDAAGMRADVEALLAGLGSDGQEVRDLPDDVTRSEKFDREVMEELSLILAEGRTTEDVPEEQDPARSVPPTSPKVLPYFMPPKAATKQRPSLQPTEDTHLPSYLDPEPSSREHPQQEVIGIEFGATPIGATPMPPDRPAEEAATEAGRPPRPAPAPAEEPEPAPAPAPKPPPVVQEPEEAEETESMAGRLLTVALVPVALGLGLLAMVGFGSILTVNIAANHVTSAEHNAEERRATLHEALRQESDVVRLLGELGADRERLEGLYLMWDELKTEPEKTRAAVDFLDACDAEGKKWVDEDGATPTQVQATHSLRRLRAARTGFEAAMGDWREAASGPTGWLGTTLGGAPTPR